MPAVAHIYICMYVCMYVCIYLYIFTYLFIYLNISIYLSIYLFFNCLFKYSKRYVWAVNHGWDARQSIHKNRPLSFGDGLFCLFLRIPCKRNNPIFSNCTNQQLSPLTGFYISIYLYLYIYNIVIPFTTGPKLVTLLNIVNIQQLTSPVYNASNIQ